MAIICTKYLDGTNYCSKHYKEIIMKNFEPKKGSSPSTEKKHAPSKGHHLSNEDRKKGGSHLKGGRK